MDEGAPSNLSYDLNFFICKQIILILSNSVLNCNLDEGCVHHLAPIWESEINSNKHIFCPHCNSISWYFTNPWNSETFSRNWRLCWEFCTYQNWSLHTSFSSCQKEVLFFFKLKNCTACDLLSVTKSVILNSGHRA